MLLKPLGTSVWHGPIGFGASRRLGLRAFAELVVLWGQRTIGSRGRFRERLRVLCGRECLAAATGITRLTRGDQNARSYRLLRVLLASSAREQEREEVFMCTKK